MNSFDLAYGTSEGPTCKKIQNYIFKFSDLLGQGNFSKVYKAHHQITNDIVAIKIVELNSLKSKKLQELLFSEINILKKLSHPNILGCFEVFTSNRNCYIITQLCNQGDLQTKLKKKKYFSQQYAEPIIRDIFQGLLYLAEQNVIHRDLKVANVFIHNGKAKIADFGFSKYTKTKFKDINIGSPIYMSPQGFIDNIYGPKTDIWAFGVLIYQLLHGETPYHLCKTQSQLKRQLSLSLNPKRIRKSISEDLKQVILRCMQVNEEKRISAFQLVNLPYFRKILRKQGSIVKIHSDKNKKNQIPYESRSRFPSFQTKNNNYLSTTLQFQKNTQKHRKMSIEKDNHQVNFITGNDDGNTYNFISAHNINMIGSIKINDGSQNRTRQRGTTSDKKQGNNQRSKSIQKKQGIKLISNSRLPKAISTSISFKQAVNLLHYGRLIFKFITFLKEQLDWNNIYLNEVHVLTKWLFVLLDEIAQKIEAKEVVYEEINAQLREKKLIEVAAQYQRKYRKELYPQLIEINRMDKFSLIDLEYVKKFLYDQYLQYDKKLISNNEISKSILFFGHNIMMIYDVTHLLDRCYADKNYSVFENYKDIEIFLSKSKETIDMEGYQQKRKGMAIYA